MSLWTEIRRRNVFRVGLAYLAVVWLIVQIASIVLPAFDLSPLAMQAVIVASVIGFPVVLVCTWIYELTPEGLKRTEDVPAEASRAFHSGRKLDFVIIGVLSLALVTVFIDQYILDADPVYESIAVLPFQNLSGDPGEEYFADGMTEALIANLAKIEAIRVVSRTSAMQFKGTDLSLPEIAARLGATAIVEASAQRDGDRVQIIAQLIDAKSDQHLWAETFDRDIEDVLSLQSEMAQEIARQIRVTITPEEHDRLAASVAVNPAAYDAYLRGLEHLYRLTPNELDLAEGYFEQARDLDANSPLGFAGLALTWGYRAQLGEVPPNVAASLVRGYAQRAELIDQQIAAVQRALATVAYLAGELGVAEAQLRRAIALEPGNAEAHFGLSNLQVILGDSPAASEQIDEAIRLDPLNPLYKMFQGVVLMGARDYDASIAAHREALEMAPNLATAWLNMVASLHLADRRNEAVEAERAWLSATRNGAATAAFEAGLAEGGYTEGMHRVAATLERQSLATGVQTINVARHYSRTTESEKIVEWLLRAFELGDPGAFYINSPEWDEVREDPRIQPLLERLRI